MKYKSLFITFSMLVFSCSSDSEEPNNPKPPIQGEPDTTAPVIAIGGLENDVETLTTLNVTITDESNSVNTVIMVNGNEVFSTTDKTIPYELDPFDFPSGATTLTVQSTDDSENQGTESQSFELKKLLYRSTDLSGDDPSNDFVDLHIAINSEETGELIASRKMQTYDDAVFYAPEDFQRQEIVVTKYVLGKNDFLHLNVATSFASLQPGIEIMTVEQAVDKLGLNTSGVGARDGQFALNIIDAPASPSFALNTGRDYGANGGPTSFELSYDMENTQNIFVYYGMFSSSIDDYRYTIIDEFVNQTLSFNDFNVLSQNEIQTNVLPNNTQNYSLELRGYLDNDLYETDTYRELYRSSTAMTGSMDAYDFPLIDFFQVLLQRLYIDLDDGRRIFASFKGLSELEIPDLSVERTGDIINISGDHDTHTLIQDIEGPLLPNYSDPILFRRFYVDDDSNSATLPFDTLEIPEEVILDLTDKGFSINSTNTSGKFSMEVTKREREIQYQDRIFYSIQRNEAGDTYTVTFPLD